MAIDGRLVPSLLLPESLWDPASATLQNPPALARAYTAVVDRHGLRRLAESRGPRDHPVGGASRVDTEQHFAQSFGASAARMQLALLDPRHDLEEVPDSLIVALAGNQVCLTDAPCGAAAASLGILASLAELRAQNVLPRLPLDVTLIGAEISEVARDYAVEVLDELRGELAAQAIFVDHEFLPWDVTNSMSTTNLVKRMTLRSVDTSKSVLIVANFNAVLEKERKRERAERQLNEIFRYASGTPGVALWVEPMMNRALAPGGLFAWIRSKIIGPWKAFVDLVEGGESGVRTTEAYHRLALINSRSVRVRLAVMQFNLVRTP